MWCVCTLYISTLPCESKLALTFCYYRFYSKQTEFVLGVYLQNVNLVRQYCNGFKNIILKRSPKLN